MAKGKQDFFKKVQQFENDFKDGRKGRDKLINVPDGKYTVRASELGLFVTEKGIPGVRIETVVVGAADEDDLGQKATYLQMIEERSGEKNGKSWKITRKDCFMNLCNALQSFGIDTEELELSDLEEVADTIAEDNPCCKIEVKTNAGGYSNIKFGKFVEDDDAYPSIDDVLDEDSESSDDEDDEEEDDDDVEETDDVEEDDEDEDIDEEDEDDDEEYVPEKGDVVDAKPAKTKTTAVYTVATVNNRKQTCTLVRESDSKEFKNVAWSVIEGLAS